MDFVQVFQRIFIKTGLVVSSALLEEQPVEKGFWSISEVGQGSLSPLVIKPGKQLQEAWKAMSEVLCSKHYVLYGYIFIYFCWFPSQMKKYSTLIWHACWKAGF